MHITKQHLETKHTRASDGSRPMLTYLKLKADKEAQTVTSVATDSLRLIQQTSRQPVEEDQELWLSKTDIAKMELDFKEVTKHPEIGVEVRYSTEAPGKFPSYEQIIPKDEAPFSVHVSAELLKEMLKVFTKEKDSANTIEIEFRPNNQPLILKGTRSNCEILALLMPVRV